MWLFLGLSMLAIVIFGERPTEALIRVRLCVTGLLQRTAQQKTFLFFEILLLLIHVLNMLQPVSLYNTWFDWYLGILS